MKEKKELWEDLKNHQGSPLFRNKPWLIFGDFNEILEAEKHSGDWNHTTVVMREIQDVVRYNSLVDMTSHGPQFTWCNKRE